MNLKRKLAIAGIAALPITGATSALILSVAPAAHAQPTSQRAAGHDAPEAPSSANDPVGGPNVQEGGNVQQGGPDPTAGPSAESLGGDVSTEGNQAGADPAGGPDVQQGANLQQGPDVQQ